MDLIGYVLLALNSVTFLIYGIDKLKAKSSKSRIPETTLLLFALLGGSLGAWLGMKVWRHKTQHKKFYIGVPFIVILQVLIIIYLQI